MPDSIRGGSDDRGVSEIIGYVLVFALIFTTVGIVSISGLPALDSARETEQLQNTERAFDVLDSNMAEVYERGAPSRATELNADDATVETGEAVTFNVSVTEAGSGNVSYTEAEINPIVFSGLGETEFVYEAGAIIRENPDYSVMLRDPPFKFGENRAFVTLVRTFSDSRQSTGGGTVLVRALSASRSVEVADVSTERSQYEQLTIEVSDSPRLEVWETYFESTLPDPDCTTTDGLRCEVDLTETSITQTYVTLQGVEIDLEI